MSDRSNAGKPANPFDRDISAVAKVMTGTGGASRSAYAGDIRESEAETATLEDKNIFFQADLAMKTCQMTSAQLERLFVRLEPVMQHSGLTDSPEDSSIAKDVDPSSQIARMFKQITAQQRGLQERIEAALQLLDV
jgi:predicted nucleic acid-binding Zn ribbon protein